MFDNIRIVLNSSAEANRRTRRTSLLFGHFHRDLVSPSSGEICFLRQTVNSDLHSCQSL